MIAFLTIIYVGLAYLVFFQFKLLPFDLKNKIATAVIGMLFVCGILIAVNFLHPMTMDARVFRYVIQIAPRPFATRPSYRSAGRTERPGKEGRGTIPNRQTPLRV